LGSPVALQDLLVNITFLVIIAIANSMGTIPSAGVGVAEKLCAFVMLVPSAYMQSMSAFVAQNIGELYEEAVKDTMQLLRYEDLHKAVLLLKYHEEIHIFSAGTAINQAESFREKMLKIGKRVVIFNNLNYQRYQACCLSERDLAMIISYSGETAQMLEIARQCKRSGTPILALTSFGENSLTCYADCKLTLSTKESIYQNLGDYASHLSMTLLLDILYSEYFRQNYQKNYTYKLERARELEQHRTSTNPILLNLHKENAE